MLRRPASDTFFPDRYTGAGTARLSVPELPVPPVVPVLPVVPVVVAVPPVEDAATGVPITWPLMIVGAAVPLEAAFR